ncbi:MAG: isocitrate/isopropylmalate dehydrogenase family protein [Endomicrobiia bacterium]|nr:isocitrate/isopropylmalate dehydrogenase family protein [Endomicrobiia bacterium]
MKTHKVTLIPGDGTGPEIVEAVKKVVAAAGVSIEWETVDAGADAMEKYGTPLPLQALESVRRNKVALKGPITTPVGTGFRSVNVALRKELDLYACLRPCKLYPGIKAPHDGVDLVVVRENTEDLYAGIEYAAGSPDAEALIAKHKGKIHPGAAISIKPISPSATQRIVKFAFDYALKHNRKKVTAVAKANIMKFTDGLFFEVARKVASRHPQIEYEERLVDNMCMQLVVKPRLYDVLVLPNLYGDIISDLCAGLVGGLGVAPGGNFGDDIALFEAVHGSAPKYKGMNKVNPIALVLSGVMMLEHFKETEAASRLENAVAAVLAEGKTLTYDLGGSASTLAVADAIIEKMQDCKIVDGR